MSVEPKFSPTVQSRNEIEHNFTYHKPTLEDANRIEFLRDHFKRLGHLLSQHCKPCRELSLAMTKLEEANMWANAAIVRHQDEVDNHFVKE